MWLYFIVWCFLVLSNEWAFGSYHINGQSELIEDIEPACERDYGYGRDKKSEGRMIYFLSSGSYMTQRVDKARYSSNTNMLQDPYFDNYKLSRRFNVVFDISDISKIQLFFIDVCYVQSMHIGVVSRNIMGNIGVMWDSMYLTTEAVCVKPTSLKATELFYKDNQYIVPILDVSVANNYMRRLIVSDFLICAFVDTLFYDVYRLDSVCGVDINWAFLDSAELYKGFYFVRTYVCGVFGFQLDVLNIYRCSLGMKLLSMVGKVYDVKYIAGGSGVEIESSIVDNLCFGGWFIMKIGWELQGGSMVFCLLDVKHCCVYASGLIEAFYTVAGCGLGIEVAF